jgi:hypothetical protein
VASALQFHGGQLATIMQQSKKMASGAGTAEMRQHLIASCVALHSHNSQVPTPRQQQQAGAAADARAVAAAAFRADPSPPPITATPTLSGEAVAEQPAGHGSKALGAEAAPDAAFAPSAAHPCVQQ